MARSRLNPAVFIILMDAAEKIAFVGLAKNVINDEPFTAETKSISIWLSVRCFFPWIGGVMADSYLGRFKTIIIFSLIYCLSLIMLILSVTLMKDNKKLIVSSLYVLSISHGGLSVCLQPFAADQFDENMEEERRNQSSFFNWWQLATLLGSVSAVSLVAYVQDNIGWVAARKVLLVVLTIALLLFFIGIKWYRKEGPKGSPYTSFAQVCVAALRKWHLKGTPGHNNYYYGHDHGGSENRQIQPNVCSDQYRFLDKAMIIDERDASSRARDPWRLCSVTQVEEVKLVIRLFLIWITCVMFYVAQSQQQTFFYEQGCTLVRSIGPDFQIPSASLRSIVGILTSCAIPIYAWCFVPIARKITGHHYGITMLQRIGVGLALSILGLVVSALVEAKRVGVARNHNLTRNTGATIPMSIWWLVPQYAILGISNVFTNIGLQELLYNQMPKTMKSLGAVAYISLGEVGRFLSKAMVVAIVKITSRAGGQWLGEDLNVAHLDLFYWLLAGLSALNLCFYLWMTNGFVYKMVHVAETTVELELDI